MTYHARALLLDVSLVVLVVVGIYLLRISLEPDFIPLRYPIPTLLLLLAIWVSVMHIEGAYSPRILGSGVQEFKVVTGASFKGFLLVCLLGLATNQHPPRINLFLGWFGSVVLVSFGRKFLQKIMHRKRRSGSDLRNVLILGSNEYATGLTSKFTREPHLGMRTFDNIPFYTVDSNIRDDQWLESIDHRVLAGDVEKLIIEPTNAASPELLSRLSWYLTKHKVEILVAPTFLQQFGPRLKFSPHSELPLVFIDEPELSMSDRIVKRLMDIALTSLAVVILLPIMVLIGLGVFISDPGPIFFIQDRVGRSGKLFRFVKFRSMVVGAENMRQNVLGTQDEEMVDRYKNDPRIYPFGRILRRYSLDELPQLYSIIRGKMSIVGPRPLLVEELPLLGDEDHRRHLAKPGLTGLWQINGRKETSWDERIQLDLRYVHDWSIGLDLGIIFKTINVVLSGRGSY